MYDKEMVASSYNKLAAISSVGFFVVSLREEKEREGSSKIKKTVKSEGASEFLSGFQPHQERNPHETRESLNGILTQDLNVFLYKVNRYPFH